MRICWLFPLLVVCLPWAARGQVSFQPFPNGGPAFYTGYISCIGDVNGDGRNDLVVANGVANNPPGFDNTLRIWLQTAAGTLGTPVNYPFASPTSWAPTGIDIADLNNDGRNDILLSHGYTVSIRFQTQAGAIGPQQNFTFASRVLACKAGDVNNDGLADIVASHTQPDSLLRVMLQTGTGFQTVTYPAPFSQSGEEIEIGDVNGDGRQDVCLMRGVGGTGQLHVFTQTSAGSLNPFTTYLVPASGSWNLRGIEVVDINSDGYTDVIGTRGSFSTYGIVTWLQHPVTHVLQAPTEFAMPHPAFPVEAADLNCDGSPEIVTSGSWGPGNVSIIGVDSNEGYFIDTTISITQVSGLQAQALSLGDFTGDTRKDFALADFNYGVILLQNTSLIPPPSVSYIVIVDTLATTTTLLQQYYGSTTTVSVNGPYTITQKDSFRVDHKMRVDSIRTDSTMITETVCGISKDTIYALTYSVATSYFNDTVILSTQTTTVLTAAVSSVHRPVASAFPNPTRGALLVEHPSGVADAMIFTPTGQRVEVSMKKTTVGVEADLGALPPGLYLLRVKSAADDGAGDVLRIIRQ